MMATRNPKVGPKKKSTGSKPKSKPEAAKEQAWTDTDDTETTKESEDVLKEAQGESSDSSEVHKGSVISVREAPDAMQSDVITNPMTTDTELPYATETDSMASFDSTGTKRRIKRNTVVPTDGEETSAGRQTPDSELKKDAWSAGEADISESDAALSRPSSAAAMYRQALVKPKNRPATAPGKRPQTTAVQRPGTAPSQYIKTSTKPGTSHKEPTIPQDDASNKPITNSGEITEAWIDNNLALKDDITKDAVSTVSSCDLLAPPRVTGEQNAYIPLFYAKDCIQKVMDDMKRMKANHIKIVDQIQDQYKSIEDEIQGKFNTFVIGLRTQYADKVHTFRHVIEIHREDTGRKQEYWQNTVKSMQAKNKKLLEEKRQLMVKNRDEFTRLEEEKIKAVKDLTGMLDEKHVKYTSMLNDLKNEQVKSLELEERLKNLQLQNQKLQEDCDANKGSYEHELLAIQMKHEKQLQEQNQQLDQLQKEKDEAFEKGHQETFEEERNRLFEENKQLVADNEMKDTELRMLREQLEKLQIEGITIASKTVEEQTQQTVKALDTTKDLSAETETKPVIATTLVQDTKEITRLTDEINKLHEENKKTTEEMYKLNQEYEQLKEQLKKDKEHIIQIQEENDQLGKDKARFEKNAKEHKQEVRDLRHQCDLLRGQLTELLQVTVHQKDDSDTEEKLKAAEAEKVALEEQQNRMKEDFEKLKEQYESEHNEQQPDEDTRNEEMQQLMEKMKEEEEKLKKAQNTIAVMTMLKEGSIPETIDASSLSTSTGRVEELEDQISKLEEERDSLELQIQKITREKENEVDRLNDENEMLSEKNSNLDDKVSELKSEIEQLKAELDETRDSIPDQPTLAVEGEDISLMSTKLADLQEEVDKASQELEQQKSENSVHLDEIEALRQELENMKEGSASGEDALRAELKSSKEQFEAEILSKSRDLDEAKKRIEELEKKLLANVPLDTIKEIESYQQKIASIQHDKENLSKENFAQKARVTTLTAKIETMTNNIERQKKAEKELQDSNKRMKVEKDKEVKEAKEKAESRSKQKIEESNKMIQMLQKRIKELEASGIPRGEAKVDSSAPKRKDSKAIDPEKVVKEKEKLTSQIEALKKAAQEDHKRIKALEKEVKDAAKSAKPAGPSAEDRAAAKKMDKQLKDAQKNLDMEKKKYEKVKESLTKTEDELKDLKKEHEALLAESKKDKADLAKLGVAAQEGLAAQEKVDELAKELSGLREENKTLSDNFNSERILRKKYYNMVEDMKGKIRVYCRARPLSKSENERGNHSVLKSPDEYSIIVSTARGPKDFQFDQVFNPEHGQEKVFEDTNNLIQSAVDGYNVCIFAYGQTGSGKTFTMIGDKEGNFPGIAPRAMDAIFSLIEQNEKKFSFKVQTYMLELYNDKLIDLLAPHSKEPAKLDIKKDKKGLVFVNGSVMLEANSKDTLWEIFERGSENRHVSSTKMNAESSRSHLILGVVIESTNLTSGAVVKGKLSLVDLAGSERAAKTGATPEQLKEAQSINKSLSALGDVISALSSDQQFIPYRNNKLTMLMQDSLGGNAKTLMFVNISPADYNTDETITSLTYASRVKLITNDAQKNADNKEISRLKGIIAKLKKGEEVEEDVD